MSANDFMQSSLIPTIGWTLLHSIWEIAAIACLLALTQLILPKHDPRISYFCGCAALILAVILPAATFIMLQSESARQTPMTSISQTINDLRMSRPTPSGLADPAGSIANASGLPISVPSWRETVSSVLHRAGEGICPALPWMVLAWTTGVLTLSIWNIGGCVALRRLKHLATYPVDASLRDAANRISHRLGLKKSVSLLQSALIDSPLVIGAIKPLVLLPVSLVAGLSPDELQLIVTHEFAHVRRHDYLVNLLQIAVETLLFYHPAIWWISSRIRAERENCCDDIVINLSQNRGVYIRALAAVAGVRSTAYAPAASGGSLLQRIRRILEPEQNTGSPRWLAGTLVLLLCIAAVVSGGLQSNARATDTSSNPSQAQPADAAPDRFVYAGQVTDINHKPIADVQVTATGRYVHGMFYIDVVKTDSSGQFRIDRDRAIGGQQPGDARSAIIRLQFDHPDFCYARLEDVQVFTPEQSANLHVTLRAGYDLQGRVIDPKGKGVVGALVQAVVAGDDEEDFRKAVLSGSDGQFELRGLTSAAASIQALVIDPGSPLLSGQISLDLTEASRPIVIEATPIDISPRQTVHELFGMKLIDADENLQGRFFLYSPKRLIILDPGPDVARLGIGDLHRGNAFWQVGDQPIANFDEFTSHLLAECQKKQSKTTDGHYFCRVVYDFSSADGTGTNTQYLHLTQRDVDELRAQEKR